MSLIFAIESTVIRMSLDNWQSHESQWQSIVIRIKNGQKYLTK